MHYDAVVVGLGGVGSFALRALSKTSGKFLGLERYRKGHLFGSSHGRTRIYRRAYFEHPSYVPWIEYSLKQFRELEASQNVSFVQECGALLVAAAPHGETTSLPPLLRASRASAELHDIEVELLNQYDLKERYPQFNHASRHTMLGLLEPQAGFLRPEKAMEAAMADAVSSGNVDIMEETDVKYFDSNETSVTLRVVTSGEDYELTTSRLLIAAGSWSSQLVPAWAPFLKVTRQIQGWIDTSYNSQSLSNQYMYSFKIMPAWYMESPDWPIPIYGLPADRTGDDASKHWIKVGTHGRNEIVEDPTNQQLQVSDHELAEMQAAATVALNRDAWSGAQPEFVDAKQCLYTMSLDGHYIIGSPRPSVFCVAGLSGHGFKNTPALGQMMAEYAEGKDLTHWNMNFCAPNRFA
jgi:sarcosine oxidase